MNHPAAAGDAGQAAERAARQSYGRLLALLAWRWRDLAAAEDALGDAFAAALRAWPSSGVPASPEAWLMKAAQRGLLMQARRARLASDPTVTALFAHDTDAPEPPAIPDERLKLMFVCAHPDVPEAVRAPLMLQTVLGLDAKVIAQAFLVSPAAMAQRLVRAKASIREAGTRFEPPELRELPDRLGSVVEAIYGAYTVGRRSAAPAVDSPGSPELAQEAIYLCQLVVQLQPQQPEALGLLALMLYAQARRPAQFDAHDAFVPLAAQDTDLWDRELIAQAERCLQAAAQCRQPGPFQIEAAIQSAHCQRAFGGATPWPAIASLYGALVALQASVGACVGQAVALAEAGELAAGRAALDALEPGVVQAYQPYWVAQAHLLRREGRLGEAAQASLRAIGLTEDPRVRAYLQRGV